MKRLTVFFTPLAEEDLDQIESHILSHDIAAAARVREAIVRQSLELGAMPKKGMPLKSPRNEQEIGVRIWPVTRYRNYLIIYRVEPAQIRVLRILHAARDWTRFFGE